MKLWSYQLAVAAAGLALASGVTRAQEPSGPTPVTAPTTTAASAPVRSAEADLKVAAPASTEADLALLEQAALERGAVVSELAREPAAKILAAALARMVAPVNAPASRAPATTAP